MKKMIGVMPLWDEERGSIWMLPEYLEGLLGAGALPVIFPLITDEQDIVRLCRGCHGFLFTGGHDVSPALYGAEEMPGVVCCRERDQMEGIVLRYALAEGKAVFGICRGIQFVNAALGGTLYQDLPTQRPFGVEHHMQPPYDKVCHTVRIVKGTPLDALFRTPQLGVNSYHHQAIRVLAPELSAMAISEDGLIEAVCHKKHRFLWAVQWHPEFSLRTDEHSRMLWKAFVEHC